MKEYIVEYETDQVGNGTVFYGGKIKHKLIRCKDCKNNPSTLIGWIECPMTGAGTRQPNDFCSYAKPKENER